MDILLISGGTYLILGLIVAILDAAFYNKRNFDLWDPPLTVQERITMFLIITVFWFFEFLIIVSREGFK